ncbi:uncharacterized protein LOC112344632 [Selaginella moellendorffii]|uniref:uncharacterized protein LOC112344632 n=1 Tax=Selaginella moellendorffii TaxID=88036 RepID=UPI000D1D0160|nr:uncharacterized protein LOC112344632 [Selaginella moellendorffii]|eukprot:XP_024525504.1 uncharacterized protein LOC112344632 [Selaginella moellendorffii]
MAFSLSISPFCAQIPALRAKRIKSRPLGSIKSSSRPEIPVQKEIFKPTALYLAAALGIGYGVLSHTHPDAAHAAIDLHGSTDGRNLGDLAMGPEGPLLEEFWDNMRRYGIYFLTVATGGLYSIFKPIFDLLSNPVTGVLAVIVIVGGLYLVYLTLSAMLGVSDYPY